MSNPFSNLQSIKRGRGRPAKIELEQPEKFFNDLKAALHIINDIPFSAVDRLTKNENSRDDLINLARACFRILDEAGIDFIKEVDRLEEKSNAKPIDMNKLEEAFQAGELTIEGLRKKGLEISFTRNGPVIMPIGSKK